jgi:hypothetical protein
LIASWAQCNTEASQKNETLPSSSQPFIAQRTISVTVTALLRRADGTSAQESLDATIWERPRVRGFLSILGKPLKIERSKAGRCSATLADQQRRPDPPDRRAGRFLFWTDLRT